MSPSFRSEAGSANVDTVAWIRLRQFHKVEMVKFAKPEESYDELENGVNAENILQKPEPSIPCGSLHWSTWAFSGPRLMDLEAV